MPREDLANLCEVTIELVEHVQQEIRIVGFWKKPAARESLRNWIVTFLDEKDVMNFDRLIGGLSEVEVSD